MTELATLPTTKAASFYDAVRSRRSIRAFLPDPVPEFVLEAVFSDAQQAPSNCNTQPWLTHVVSGKARDRLSAAMVEAATSGRMTPDFSFDMDEYFGRYADRQKDQASALYGSLGIARDDEAGRFGNLVDNFRFFDAPHAALLFMPVFGDAVRVASDVGMYGQTLLLSLAANGLGAIPQTSLGFVADTAREVLGVAPEFKLLFGISFGFADPQASVNQFRMDRAPLAESVTFHN